MAKKVSVIDYGRGNLGSVAKALEVAGGEVRVVKDRAEVLAADRIVLPGQGAFADCMTTLASRGLLEGVREKIEGGTPYLGLCLGLQILFEHSEEHGGKEGLGIIPGRVIRFPDPGFTQLKVPHMGWNSIRKEREAGLFSRIPQEEYFYFVHSYFAQLTPDNRNWVAATTDYGTNFISAVSKDNVHATQFHPEKSQSAGIRLLENFLAL